MLVPREKAAHWYTREGVPMFTVPKKTGGCRNTTVKDAREMGLIPSVTTILKLLSKDSLVAWRIEQAILAALTLPRLTSETNDHFARRVIEDMDAQSEKAREFGVAIHEAVNNKITHNVEMLDGPYREFIAPVMKYIDDEKIKGKCEIVVATDDYAGTVDFMGWVGTGSSSMIIDWKTQNTKPDKKVIYYDEWAYQLAAYQRAIPNRPEIGRAHV